MSAAPPAAIGRATDVHGIPVRAEDSARIRTAAVATTVRRAWVRPVRDAAVAGVALAVAVVAGSEGLEHIDPALLGYLGATSFAFVATVYRASGFWRRPASAFYARALAAALLRPASLGAVFANAGRDIAAQSFLRRRSILRWLAHLALSLGTLASLAITVPLVFGWMHFSADGGSYRAIAFGIPLVRFAVDGAMAWLVFHALTLAGIAVLLGALSFLGLRIRMRRLPGATASFAIAPLVLLLVVAGTGLALPVSRAMPGLFPIAAALHQASVVFLLVAIPFSKLGHVLIRPLQLGSRAVQAPAEPRARCACGAVLAPARQTAAVVGLLSERGFRFGTHPEQCPACRRRRVATAQAGLVGAYFQPRLPGARPARRDETAP